MTRTVENLNPREVAFAEYYGLVGSETYSNASASAKKAGYADPTGRTAGWKLLKREAVRQKIQQVHAEQMSRLYLTCDKVLGDLEHTRLAAFAKGDLAVAVRCSELEGKFLAMFTDRQQLVGPEQQPELDERERAECLALAAIRLGCLSLPGDVGGGCGDAAVGMIEGGEKRPDGGGLTPQTPTGINSNRLPSDA